jgi:acetyl-CoA synthetase
VESVLVAHPAVVEAAVIGVPDDVKGTAIVCFVVLAPGHAPDDALRQALLQKVSDDLGKPLRPKDIRFVRDLPKTRNAKVMRRVIRSAYLGQPLGDISALENTGALDDLTKSN